MTWTPLVTTDMFTGVHTDVMTAVVALMSLALIIVGVGMIYRVFGR